MEQRCGLPTEAWPTGILFWRGLIPILVLRLERHSPGLWWIEIPLEWPREGRFAHFLSECDQRMPHTTVHIPLQEWNMGQRASSTTGVTFEDVVVPEEVVMWWSCDTLLPLLYVLPFSCLPSERGGGAGSGVQVGHGSLRHDKTCGMYIVYIQHASKLCYSWPHVYLITLFVCT